MASCQPAQGHFRTATIESCGVDIVCVCVCVWGGGGGGGVILCGWSGLVIGFFLKTLASQLPVEPTPAGRWSVWAMVPWSSGLFWRWSRGAVVCSGDGPVEQWSVRAMVRWSSGLSGRWSGGAMVHLGDGPVEQWSSGDGPVEQWGDPE